MTEPQPHRGPRSAFALLADSYDPGEPDPLAEAVGDLSALGDGPTLDELLTEDGAAAMLADAHRLADALPQLGKPGPDTGDVHDRRLPHGTEVRQRHP